MSEANIIYKVLALQLLETGSCALSNAQIAEFFVQNKYTDYFTIQRTLHELENAHLVLANTTNNLTLYTLTEGGRETLHAMKDRINEAMLTDMANFFALHNVDISRTSQVFADYYPAAQTGYNVHCLVIEEGNTLIDVTLWVGSQDQAKTLCTNWQRDYQNVYASFMEILLY